jgi:hypothetical protein
MTPNYDARRVKGDDLRTHRIARFENGLRQMHADLCSSAIVTIQKFRHVSNDYIAAGIKPGFRDHAKSIITGLYNTSKSHAVDCCTRMYMDSQDKKSDQKFR